jgi:hypothetical protein
MWYFALVPTYLVWHYTLAISDLRRLAKNILWFIFNFFSIDILLGTLLSPWKRLSKDVDPHSSFFSNLVINTTMRFVGLFIRGATIIFGTLSLLAALTAFAAGFLVWLVLPFLVPALFLYGINYFIL